MTPARLVYLALLVLVASPVHAADKPPLWGDLQPGPYAVGVRSLLEEDASRSWADPASAETKWWPRPVRMLLWYPASGNSKGGTFRQYVTTPASRYPQSISAIFAEHDLGKGPIGKGLAGFFGGSEEKLDAFLNTRVAAKLDARPAKGRFPLLVYSLGQNNILQENVVLAEYLASHGYVVVTPAHLGTNARRRFLLIHDRGSYEDQVRDLEFALNHAAREPFVDRDRIVAAGHSMGGEYALLLAMRNPRIRALVGLDPSFVARGESYKLKLPTLPFFNAAVVRMPILIQARTRQDENPEIVDQLRFAGVTWIRYDRASHGDFNSGAMYQRNVAPADQNQEDLKIRTPEEAARVFEMSAANVLRFLDRALAGQPFEPELAPNVTATITKRAAITAPDEEAFYRIVRDRGIDEALAVLERAEAVAGKPVIDEAIVERIANEFSYTGREAESKRMFAFLEAIRKRVR